MSTRIDRPEGDLPRNLAGEVFGEGLAQWSEVPPTRIWGPVVYRWEAAATVHQPLYFEEVNLERYGYTCRALHLFQPVFSGARFFATIPAMPYFTAARPPWERIYTLGHYRSGSPVPCRPHWIELRPGPGAVQAAAVNAVVFTIP